jgi:agmatine deiminase
MIWRMPAEWTEHEKTWMAWPCASYTLGETDADAQEAYETWANVANAIIKFEPVSMAVRAGDIERASEMLHPDIELINIDLDDSWMRDIGPTFVKNEAGQVAAIDWVFNGWGGQGNWASWAKDSAVASNIAAFEDVEVHSSKLVNEGGGIHVNGAGTVLLTETVQLGKGRNPDLSRQEVEAEIHKQLGTNRAVWLRRGLTRDYEEFGTQGHVDIVACFVSEDTILFHDQQDESHPDFSVSHEVKRTLEEAGGFKLIAMPAPKTLKDAEGWVDYSYINHYVVNGGVILCAFDDENDAIAKSILEKCYPGREVVLVDARPLFARGGGIHCITQQQPK